MISFIEKRRFTKPFKLLSFFICLTFSSSLIILPPSVQAQSAINLPVPGTMVYMSPEFVSPFLKGITIHPENPFQFDFIVDAGHSGLKGDNLKEESTKLIKYFLATLTTPEDDLWVNLSPYEGDRIIPEEFGKTEMGRDLLAQDYLLKQLTASLLYPEEDLGKEFWDKVYEKANSLYGTSEMPVNTFNKVWIVPEKAVVYEHKNTVIVIDSHLKVLLEEDYLATSKNLNNGDIGTDQLEQKDIEALGNASSSVIKEVIIPEIEKEVNEGKNFALLRQIYQSMILATWYKKKLQSSPLNQLYVDKRKVAGVDVEDKDIKQKIYNQYIDAFRKGVYDYIKEDYDEASQEIIRRKYFSGGVAPLKREAVVAQTPESYVPSVQDTQAVAEDGFEVHSVNLKPVDVRQLEVFRRLLRRIASNQTGRSLSDEEFSDIEMMQVLAERLVEENLAVEIEVEDIVNEEQIRQALTDDVQFDPSGKIVVVRINESAVQGNSLLRALKEKFVNAQGEAVQGMNWKASDNVTERWQGKGLVIIFENEWENNQDVREHEYVELGLVVSNPNMGWAEAHDLTVDVMGIGQKINQEKLAGYKGSIGAGIGDWFRKKSGDKEGQGEQQNVFDSMRERLDLLFELEDAARKGNDAEVRRLSEVLSLPAEEPSLSETLGRHRRALQESYWRGIVADAQQSEEALEALAREVEGEITTIKEQIERGEFERAHFAITPIWMYTGNLPVREDIKGEIFDLVKRADIGSIPARLRSKRKAEVVDGLRDYINNRKDVGDPQAFQETFLELILENSSEFFDDPSGYASAIVLDTFYSPLFQATAFGEKVFAGEDIAQRLIDTENPILVMMGHALLGDLAVHPEVIDAVNQTLTEKTTQQERSLQGEGEEVPYFPAVGRVIETLDHVQGIIIKENLEAKKRGVRPAHFTDERWRMVQGFSSDDTDALWREKDRLDWESQQRSRSEEPEEGTLRARIDDIKDEQRYRDYRNRLISESSEEKAAVLSESLAFSTRPLLAEELLTASRELMDEYPGDIGFVERVLQNFSHMHGLSRYDKEKWQRLKREMLAVAENHRNDEDMRIRLIVYRLLDQESEEDTIVRSAVATKQTLEGDVVADYQVRAIAAWAEKEMFYHENDERRALRVRNQLQSPLIEDRVAALQGAPLISSLVQEDLERFVVDVLENSRQEEFTLASQALGLLKDTSGIRPELISRLDRENRDAIQNEISAQEMGNELKDRVVRGFLLDNNLQNLGQAMAVAQSVLAGESMAIWTLANMTDQWDVDDDKFLLKDLNITIQGIGRVVVAEDGFLRINVLDGDEIASDPERAEKLELAQNLVNYINQDIIYPLIHLRMFRQTFFNYSREYQKAFSSLMMVRSYFVIDGVRRLAGFDGTTVPEARYSINGRVLDKSLPVPVQAIRSWFGQRFEGDELAVLEGLEEVPVHILGVGLETEVLRGLTTGVVTKTLSDNVRLTESVEKMTSALELLARGSAMGKTADFSNALQQLEEASIDYQSLMSASLEAHLKGSEEADNRQGLFVEVGRDVIQSLRDKGADPNLVQQLTHFYVDFGRLWNDSQLWTYDFLPPFVDLIRKPSIATLTEEQQAVRGEATQSLKGLITQLENLYVNRSALELMLTQSGVGIGLNEGLSQIQSALARLYLEYAFILPFSRESAFYLHRAIEMDPNVSVESEVNIPGRTIRRFGDSPELAAQIQQFYRQSRNPDQVRYLNSILEKAKQESREAARRGKLASDKYTDEPSQPGQDSGDNAMVSSPGGIDFNSAWLELQTQGKGNEIYFNYDLPSIENIQIQGLTPFIFNVTPLPNLSPILGLGIKEKEQALSLVQ